MVPGWDVVEKKTGDLVRTAGWTGRLQVVPQPKRGGAVRSTLVLRHRFYAGALPNPSNKAVDK